MKYLITEKQLKTLRKYMKTFVNEGYNDNLPLGAADDPRNPENQPYGGREDGDFRIVTITYNGKKVAKATVDYDDNEIYTDFYTNNRDMNNTIEDKLDELKAGGMGEVDIILDGDTITYQELMADY